MFVKFFFHFSYLPMCSKGCSIFVLFCLDLDLFAKIKRPGFYSLTEARFINNSGSNQNKKKNPEYPFVDTGK